MIFGAKLKNRRAKKKLLLPSLKMRVPNGSGSRRPRSIPKKTGVLRKNAYAVIQNVGAKRKWLTPSSFDFHKKQA